MPPGDRAPRRQTSSIRPVAVDVPLPDPEPDLAPGRRYRILISFEDFTAGETREIVPTPRLEVLVQMGLLRPED